MTTEQVPSLNKFWRMLRNHDWTYNYSDDHSVWRRGESQLAAIREVVEAGGDEYKKLFISYSEYAWRKDDSIKQPECPLFSKEDREHYRKIIENIALALEHLKDETWAIEEDQITSSTQLYKILNPVSSMLYWIRGIIDEKSKSSLWDTVAYKGYKRIKEQLDNI